MDKWWNNIDWRCIQMNFREIDMLDVKKENIIEYLKEFKATVFMINTGGIIASYKTKLSFQHQSEFLKSDSLLDIINACHEENIKVIARMDFSKIREDIFEKHPEWAFRTENNEVINYNGNISTCLNGGYQQEAIFDILEEVIDTLHVDGFYFNMPGMRVFDYHLNFFGLCHCEACKTKFKEQYGLDIPKFKNIEFPINIRDPKIAQASRTKEMVAYSRFSNEAEEKLTQKIRSFIHEKNPNIAVMDVDYVRSESNTEIDRALPRLAYDSSMNNRMNLGTEQEMISSNTSVDFVGFSYRHISVSPALQSLRLWQSMANLGGLDYYLIGRMDNHLDKTAFEKIKNVYNFRVKHADYFKGLRSEAKVLLVHTGHPRQPTNEEKGWVMSLTENHIPFSEVSHNRISDIDLNKYDTVIVSANMPDDLIVKVERYVSQGGKLLLTGKLSKNELLRNLVGINESIGFENNMLSCMFEIDDSDYTDFKNLRKTKVVFFGKTYDRHIYNKEVKKWMKLTKPQRYGPPEMVYGSGTEDFPGVTMNSYSKGKVCYVPADLGSIYFREGWDNTSLFMKDILTNILGHYDLAPSLTRMAEVTWAYNDKLNVDLIQIVNATGYFGVQVYDPVRLYDVSLNIPVIAPVKSVKRMSNNELLQFELKDNLLYINLDIIDEYEALIIENY